MEKVSHLKMEMKILWYFTCNMEKLPCFYRRSGKYRRRAVGRENKESPEKGELPACYDLLKVGHHGSRNATGEELLEVIRPRVAFCSSGKENRYGHPHAETLERLANGA